MTQRTGDRAYGSVRLASSRISDIPLPRGKLWTISGCRECRSGAQLGAIRARSQKPIVGVRSAILGGGVDARSITKRSEALSHPSGPLWMTKMKPDATWTAESAK